MDNFTYNWMCHVTDKGERGDFLFYFLEIDI